MTRSQLRLIARTLGVIVFGVCFALVVEQSQDSGVRSAVPHPSPAAERRAPAPAPKVAVPTALVGSTPSAAPASPPSGAAFGGLPSVGAIFVPGPDGKADPRRHYCTATVVDSQSGDVIATAAHCLSDPANGITTPSPFVFVPGYHDGQEPYGEWTPERVVVDPHWSTSSDPDYDVAFVVLRQTGGAGKRLADMVGAQHISFSPQRPAQVGAIGYPSGTEQPIACSSTLKPYEPTQSEFDCAGFADGSSGGPMLTGIDTGTGEGTLVGVIGGYQEGGDSPDISYSSYFSDAVRALYQQATGG